MSKSISSAAELIRKGGTLLAEACEACSGVQIRFENNIICVGCGKRINRESRHEPKEIITNKIKELIQLLEKEDDRSKQLEISELIINYLTILEKIDKIL